MSFLRFGGAARRAPLLSDGKARQIQRHASFVCLSYTSEKNAREKLPRRHHRGDIFLSHTCPFRARNSFFCQKW